MILEIIFNAKSGHTGGSLSSVDILVALYMNILKIKPEYPAWEERDRFIMSKGHSVEGYYCTLAEAGFFSKEALNTYGQFKSMFAGHPTRNVPGVELNSGALGHGLSVGVGMALAAKRDRRNYRVFVLMGDGEQGEGSVMEAAMSGSHYKLDNLIAIIDRNRLQISGYTEDIMSLDCLSDRWSAYGWKVREVDGNNIKELLNIFRKVPFETGKPSLILAVTTKGKGISFIENRANWHHKVPSEEEFVKAMEELDAQMIQLNNGE